MSRTAQTELAVLGALSVGPMSGYAVRQAIAETLGHFWHESYGQIYPTLTALQTQGLVRRGGPGATSGSVFRITAAGRRRLRRLLAEPAPAPAPPRDGLLLRLFFGRQLGVEGTRALLTEALAATEAKAAALAALRAEVQAEPQTADHPYWLMTISAGEHAAAARIAWLRESLARLDDLRGMPPAPAPANAPRTAVDTERNRGTARDQQGDSSRSRT